MADSGDGVLIPVSELKKFLVEHRVAEALNIGAQSYWFDKFRSGAVQPVYFFYLYQARQLKFRSRAAWAYLAESSYVAQWERNDFPVKILEFDVIMLYFWMYLCIPTC